MASHDKTSAELEREVEMQRGRVSDTIDELQSKLSPGQLVDQLMAYTKGGAGDFATNMGKSVRDNPLPVALVGLGLFWLMAGKSPIDALGVGHHGSTSSRPSGNGLHEPYYDERNKTSAGGGIGEGIADAARGFGDKVSGLVSDTGDRISTLAGDASSGMSDVGSDIHGALDQAGSAMAGVRDQVNRSAHDIRDQFSSVQNKAINLFSDQPLIAGALAFAAGAALGAAIPVTAKERELVGDAAGELVAAAQKAAEPLIEQGKDMLDKAMDDGKSLLGDVTAKGQSILEDAQEKVGETYGDLKNAAEEKVDELIGSEKKKRKVPNAPKSTQY